MAVSIQSVKVQSGELARLNFWACKGLDLKVTIGCDVCPGKSQTLILPCRVLGVHFLDGLCQLCARPLLAELEFVH